MKTLVLGLGVGGIRSVNSASQALMSPLLVGKSHFNEEAQSTTCLASGDQPSQLKPEVPT